MDHALGDLHRGWPGSAMALPRRSTTGKMGGLTTLCEDARVASGSGLEHIELIDAAWEHDGILRLLVCVGVVEVVVQPTAFVTFDR